MCGEANELVCDVLIGARRSEGHEPAKTSSSPQSAVEAICDVVEQALSRDFPECLPKLAQTFEHIFEYTKPIKAYRCGWYPPRALHFKANNFLDIQRAIRSNI
ncbi:hypothetical protein CQZ93_24475 [Ochrobactrum vermis]|nr:hypothetical protein CQZ93_24475 [Ochrobactrum vermis]